jgi:hypothetical protein
VDTPGARAIHPLHRDGTHVVTQQSLGVTEQVDQADAGIEALEAKA